jgi:hypothetical protein
MPTESHGTLEHLCSRVVFELFSGSEIGEQDSERRQETRPDGLTDRRTDACASLGQV